MASVLSGRRTRWGGSGTGVPSRYAVDRLVLMRADGAPSRQRMRGQRGPSKEEA